MLLLEAVLGVLTEEEGLKLFPMKEGVAKLRAAMVVLPLDFEVAAADPMTANAIATVFL